MPTCSQPKCPMETNGVCLEGIGQECPHLIQTNEELKQPEIKKDPKVNERKSSHEPFRFHTGEKLTESEASRIMMARPVRLIVLAGAKGSGKTTLIAKIGEMFRSGIFEDYRFAGSKTLLAFERASWLATIVSGMNSPETKRTSHVEKDTFYHLQIQEDGIAPDSAELLISDLPGELFSDVLSSQEVCGNQLALLRADHLVLFIDSKSIADDSKRHAEKDAVHRFLSRLSECRYQPQKLRVDIIFSRWDYIEEDCKREYHEKYCSIVEEYILQRYRNTFGEVNFFKIAVRPTKSKPDLDGIRNLFSRWLMNFPNETDTQISNSNRPARDFCAFGVL